MARLSRAAVTTAVAAAALGASVIGLAAPASADPANVPPYRTYIGVGSDTTQDVMNAIAGDVPGITAVNKNIGSYNAFGSTQIKTTRLGPNWDRPGGSGAGVKALSDAMTNTPYDGVDITGQVSFARSSSGPALTGTDLTYVPFARDAVTYAFKGNAQKLGKLTTAQLNAIYSSDDAVTINGVTVTGVLPQSNSGTRKFFLSAIGVTTIGASVIQTTSPENDGSILTATNEVVPFSAAQWIGQNNGLATNTTAGVTLGKPNGLPPVGGTAGALTPVSSFYNSAPYGRYVYNVIPTSKIADGKVSKLFVGSTSSLCINAAKTVVKKFGFALITSGAACGATSITGGYTP